MDQATETAGAETATKDWPIEVRPNGTIVFDGIAIGGLDLVVEDDGVPDKQHPRVTLNLGWCRAAGVRVRVEGDPRVDHQRNGLVLER